MQEFVTPRYRATSAPEWSKSVTATCDNYSRAAMSSRFRLPDRSSLAVTRWASQVCSARERAPAGRPDPRVFLLELTHLGEDRSYELSIFQDPPIRCLPFSPPLKVKTDRCLNSLDIQYPFSV